MNEPKDIAGKRYGRWTAIDYHGHDKFNLPLWRFRCDCGNEKIIERRSAERGLSKSCGCLRRELNNARKKPPTLAAPRTPNPKGRKPMEPHLKVRNHPLYSVWCGMINRCYNLTVRGYSNYGGRGIKVCDRWRKFANFRDDMPPKPTGTSIDRINNDGDYEPGNCRWATPVQQANNMRLNVRLTHNGRTLTLPEWARETGLPASTIRERILTLKWPVSEALTAPITPRTGKRRPRRKKADLGGYFLTC